MHISFEWLVWHIFKLLLLEFLGHGNSNALLLANCSKVKMALLAGSQLSDRCPFGLLVLFTSLAMPVCRDTCRLVLGTYALSSFV